MSNTLVEAETQEILVLECRGERYRIDSNGMITSDRCIIPSGQWQFLGVSTHWRHNHVVFKFDEIFKNPSLAVRGYVWDLDHGTLRTWGGNNPRVTGCYKKKIPVYPDKALWPLKNGVVWWE